MATWGAVLAGAPGGRPPRPWVRLGPLGAPPVARWGHILAFVFLSTMTARGGQTGADHFPSKPRLVLLPAASQIGRGGREARPSKVQVWATGGLLTHHMPPKKHGSGFSNFCMESVGPVPEGWRCV
jgi:hypothetical protein